ncbi:MAG: hypothetical protein P1S46_01375 [bacterium]|nr:hypothetical protein [bacterium]MDT8394940.1 hypothetical protein [bacterium]
MSSAVIGTNHLSPKEYWNLFGKLIISADVGALSACLGWILYWFDHIPDHVIHLHGTSPLLFLVSLSAALYAAVITVRTGNRLGARNDRTWHTFEILYAFFAGVSGITAYFINPPF